MDSIKKKTKEVLEETPLLSLYMDFRQFLYFRYTVDGCVVSPPKAGRTWLRVMMAHALHYLYDTPILLDVHEIAQEDARVPYIYFTHDASNLHKNVQKSKTVHSTKFWKYDKTPIVFLHRDPRDMVVSYYHELVDRAQVPFEGDMSDFVRDERFGIRQTIAFMNNWHDYLEDREQAMYTSYEKMHEDTQRELIRIMDFFDIDIDEEGIAYAVQQARFEKMRKMEEEDALRDGRLRAAGGEGRDHHKVRKGKVGSFREELSEEDIAYVNRALEELHDDFGYAAD